MRFGKLFATSLLALPLACTPDSSVRRNDSAGWPPESPQPSTTNAPRQRSIGTYEPRPPLAARRPVEYTIHGDTRVDDYAWLRDRDNPEVVNYLNRENAFAESAMAHTKDLREQLYNEILGRIKQTDLSVPYRRDDWYYYSRTVEGLDYPILARKKGSLDAQEQVMLDLNELAKGKEYLGLGASEVSPDHNLLAYSVDFTGAEYYDVYVKDLNTGQTTGPVLTQIAGGLDWAADNKTIFYSRQDESHRPYQIWRSNVVDRTEPLPAITRKALQAVATLVYDEPDPLYFAFASKTLDEEIILFGSFGKTNSEWHFISASDPTAAPKLIAPRRPKVQYYPDHHPRGPADPEGDDGGTFFILTDENAPNFKIVTAPVSNPAPENWKDFVAHDPEVFIDGFEIFANHIVLSERRGGFTSARILTLAEDGSIASARIVELPENVATIHADTNAEFDTGTFRYSYTSYLTPPSVYDIGMNTGEQTLLKQQEVLGGYEPQQYETGVTWATAPDGTQVPISFVHKKDISRDGNNPVLLYAYGSYGASEDPYFQSARLSLLDRGVVFATAHVRGGGEMGRHWKEEGRLNRKMNTFTDFIAAAEHLIDEGWTNSERLAISGGSAGGLLIGAVVNMRPELFKAAVADVPFVDVINTMLDPTIPLTTFEYEEWGNPQEPEAYAYMKSYSPYDNVKAQEYPDLLILAGLNDPRVGFWEPAKWAAKLRATKTGDSLLVLKTNMGTGHGGPSGRYDAIREAAWEMAFVLDRLGVVASPTAASTP